MRPVALFPVRSTIVHTDNPRWMRSPRLRYFTLLLVTGVVACGDAVSPEPVEEVPAYDLLFDGEGLDGQPRLYRVKNGNGAFVDIVPVHAGRRAAPSPNGKRIVFQSTGTLEEPPTLMVLEDSQLNAVSFGAPGGLAGEAAWSPDGRFIAFLSEHEDAAGDIFVADASGRQLAQIRNLTPVNPSSFLPQPDRTPAWSPDGESIAFTAYRQGGAAIWVMKPDGTGARPVTAAGNYGDFEPSWSPDARSIAFQRADLAGVRIGVVAADGGVPRFLAWPAKAYNPSWSPDGNYIAFSSDVDGDMDIFVVTPAGTEVARVRRVGTDRNAAWIAR